MRIVKKTTTNLVYSINQTLNENIIVLFLLINKKHKSNYVLLILYFIGRASECDKMYIRKKLYLQKLYNIISITYIYITQNLINIQFFYKENIETMNLERI